MYYTEIWLGITAAWVRNILENKKNFLVDDWGCDCEVTNQSSNQRKRQPQPMQYQLELDNSLPLLKISFLFASIFVHIS